MRKLFKDRAGLVLAFVLCLVVATAGTATAAKLITGAQIKNGTITDKDLSKALRKQLAKVGQAGPKGDPGAPGAKGAAGANGTNGSNGTNGTNGAKGDQGVRGFSAWDTIPSGQTVRGSQAIEMPSAGLAGSQYQYTVALPALAPVAITNPNVNFAAGGADNDATCTGSALAPTAPAGKVCIYAGTASGVDTLTGIGQVNGGDASFRVLYHSTGVAGSDMFLTFTWAYTAP